MRILDAAEVRARLPWPALIGALEAMFRQGCEAPLRHHHGLGPSGAGQASLLLMPAWQAGGFTGVKLVHVVPANATAGLPAVHAVYLLSEAATGRPLAVLDGGELTDRRTAATSVLAARHLARPDSRRLLLLGSGRIAHALAGCYRSAFPIEEIAVWSRRPESAARLVAALAAEGHPARAAATPDPAGADIVAAATLSAEPLVRGAAVGPGTHVDLVGAFRPDMRESDGALLARARLVVDTHAGALAEAGDIRQAMAEGAIGRGDVAAELAELCRGEKPGREDARQVTVFKSVGWAGEDLAAAALAYGAAAEAP
ncbi:ornithine cyclodeaminase family protein [Roseomonas sp. OT10]|uniref:ornithine cyclodeaminase family protein n=1 Tax=Roseomonas cutis TaxID=2897332 RepID=UPI001E412CF3|nr:ornithine cyclodeaminase family protein [Roseomonas sp. OT10]UFN48874.1 ornithine cyclodeaminase family protein [Roseomonas sp. OT10]